MSATSPITVIKTVSGAEITLRWGARLDLIEGSAMSLKGEISGVVDGPYQVPMGHSNPLYDTVRAKGGTAYASLGHGKAGATLVLDEAGAAALREFRAAMQAELAHREELATERRWRDAGAACPTGYVPATVEWLNGDLMAGSYRTKDGVKVVDSDQLERHDGFVWLPADKVAAARVDRDASAERRARLRAELLAMQVPAAADEAYDRYGGSADHAWDAEDETAWSLIRRYGDAIDAQREGDAWRGLRIR